MAKLRRKGLAANAGEAIVLETLARELSDDYLVLANINLYERQFLPEVDAVVIHARALFALEIKDLHGKLEWAGPGNDWLHNGHPIADPYQQAENAAKKLSKYLRYERARQIFEDERAAGSLWVQPVLVIVDHTTDISNVANVSNVKLCHLRDLPHYLTTCHSQFHRTNFKPQEIERISGALGLRMGTTIQLAPGQPPAEQSPAPQPFVPRPKAQPQDKPYTSRKPAPPVRCPKCRWNNSPKSKFCGQCGAVLFPETAPSSPKSVQGPAPQSLAASAQQDEGGVTTGPSQAQPAVQPLSQIAPPQPAALPTQIESPQPVAPQPQAEAPQPAVSSPQVELPGPEITPPPPTEPSQPVAPPMPPPVETIPPAVAAVQKCDRCGAENKQTAHFCIKCGAALPQPAPVIAQQPLVPQPEASQVCPKCQAENKPSARFCRACGTRLS